MTPFLTELMAEEPWFKSLVQGFRMLEKDELPKGTERGTTWKSICINTALYLPWLVGQCRKNGAIVKRGVVNHITEAANLHASGKKADVVVNCTGVLACRLGGVEDKKVYPARGQVVVVRNEVPAMFTTSAVAEGDDEMMVCTTLS